MPRPAVAAQRVEGPQVAARQRAAVAPLAAELRLAAESQLAVESRPAEGQRLAVELRRVEEVGELRRLLQMLADDLASATVACLLHGGQVEQEAEARQWVLANFRTAIGKER